MYHRNKFISGTALRIRLLEMLHLPIMLALILAVVGGTRISSSDSSKHSSGESFVKAGAIIFLISFIAIVAFAVLTMTDSRNLPQGERRILYIVLASLPLLAVRLLYSLLVDFANNNTFSIVNGNPTVQLCMAIIEEFIVTVLFLVAGLVAPTLNNLMQEAGDVPMNTFNGRKGVA